MADDEPAMLEVETPTGDPAAGAAAGEPVSADGAVVVEEPLTATPEVDEATKLREENARLKGLVEGIQTVRPASAAEVPAPIQWTPQLIRQAYEQGITLMNGQQVQITDDERITLLARLEAQRMTAEQEEQRTVDAAHETVSAYVAKYPDLGVRGSALLSEVSAQIDEWRRRNPRLDPQDIRTQAMAVEVVLARKGAPVAGSSSAHEFSRRRVSAAGAAGGSVSTSADGNTRKADPLAGVPKATVDYWQEHGWIPDDAAKKRYADRYAVQQARRRRPA